MIAVSHGDFGCIEDILGNLTMIFCGTGSNNYTSEILHWIYNIKNIWTPKFAYIEDSLSVFFYQYCWFDRDIMQDSMLVNLTGLTDHWMPVDLNIKHLIKFLKV